MKENGIVQTKTEDFEQRLLSILNHSALALMLSIGHRTKLFDTMRTLGFASSETIAEKSGLTERYVRECLNALVTGGIIAFDSRKKMYRLPEEHAEFLTRGSSQNMAVIAQFIPVLAGVEDKIVEAFHSGGGVPYEAYHRFHEVMAEESAQTVLSALLDKILPLVEGLREKLETGIRVVDIGCGYGRALALLAKKFPHSRFTGFDLCEEAVTHARKQIEELELDNLAFEKMDLAEWNEKEAYDLITSFDAIHDQAQPARVLMNIYHALVSGGTFLMQDIRAASALEKNLDHPLGPFIYSISCMHCMSVSLYQNGMGLGAAWGEECAEKMLHEAGFDKVAKKYLEHDIMNTYYLMRK